MPTIFSRSRRRAGFTLIEMLVVIAIIAIIAALILAAIGGVFNTGNQALARSDILNLEAGLTKFYTKYKFYPPDQLKLHAKLSDYNQNNPLDVQSILYLSAMFPNIAWNTNPNASIAWAGATAIPGTGFTLEGDQCLVFFLGGPPNGGGQTGLMGGFSTNPADPVYLPAAGQKTLDRIKFYDFPAGRLFDRVANNPFPSYQDAWPAQGPSRPASPYFYFSNYKKTNGYVTVNLSTGSAPANTIGVGGTAILPYQPNATTFYNSDKFQILSAGLNGQFGPGGIWPPLPAAGAKAGGDDLSNFSGAQLGANVTN